MLCCAGLWAAYQAKKSVQNAGKAVEDTLENIKVEREFKNRERAIEQKYKETQKKRKTQIKKYMDENKWKFFYCLLTVHPTKKRMIPTTNTGNAGLNIISLSCNRDEENTRSLEYKKYPEHMTNNPNKVNVTDFPL